MDRMADSVLPLLDTQSTFGRSQPGDDGRFLLDQQLSAGVARDIARQLPHQERGGRAVAGVSPAQGVLHAVARSRDSPRGSARMIKGGDADATETAGAGVQGRRPEDWARISPKSASDPEGAVERLRGVEGAADAAVRDLPAASSRCAASRRRTRWRGFTSTTAPSWKRINWLADTSRKGLRESLGLMVNYLYEPRAIEGNHQKFVDGNIVASRRVRSLGAGD